eukprot:6460523-Amphidinium_carterae.1
MAHREVVNGAPPPIRVTKPYPYAWGAIPAVGMGAYPPSKKLSPPTPSSSAAEDKPPLFTR